MGSPNLEFILLSDQKKIRWPRKISEITCNYIKGAWVIGSFCGPHYINKIHVKYIVLHNSKIRIFWMKNCDISLLFLLTQIVGTQLGAVLIGIHYLCF